MIKANGGTPGVMYQAPNGDVSPITLLDTDPTDPDARLWSIEAWPDNLVTAPTISAATSNPATFTPPQAGEWYQVLLTRTIGAATFQDRLLICVPDADGIALPAPGMFADTDPTKTLVNKNARAKIVGWAGQNGAVPGLSAGVRKAMGDAAAATAANATNTEAVDTAKVKYNVLFQGAAGDGVTDDYTAIQSAINSLAADGGGELYLPAATYLISQSLAMANGVTLRGDAIGKSTILATAGVSAPWVNVPGQAMIEMRGVSHAHIRYLTIDGNAPARTPGSGGDPSTDTIDHLLIIAAGQHNSCERVEFKGAGVSAAMTSTTPSGPAVLLVAKDTSTDLGGQFGTVANQDCSDNTIRNCLFTGNGRCSKAIAGATDYGWIPPNAPDVPNGGYSPFAGSGVGYTNTTSLRSRSVDSGGDAFVNHVEDNTIEDCIFTGTWPLYVVGLQGGGTRNNIVRNCKAIECRTLYGFLGDKGDYGNVFVDCITLDHERDPYTLTTSPMASFVQHSGDFYYGYRDVFDRCVADAFVGTQVYDVPFAVGEYSIGQKVRGCTVDGAAVTGNDAIGVMLGQGAIDYEITGNDVHGCDYGIYANLGGAPTTPGRGGLIQGNRIDVVNNAILVRVVGSTIGGVVTVTDNRCKSSAAGTVGIIDVGGDGSIASAQVRDNYVQGPTSPGSGQVGFVLGMLAGKTDGNHADHCHTAYQCEATHAAQWGDGNHSTNVTTALTVSGGATFPTPDGAANTYAGALLAWLFGIYTVGTFAAASFAVDVSKARNLVCNISGACSITAFSNASQIAGRRFVLYFFMAAGSSITSWPANIKWIGGTAPILTNANVLDKIEFDTDGTNFYECPRAQNEH